MPDTYSASLRLLKMAVGGSEGTWGGNLNSNVIDMVDEAVTGILSISVTAADVTLTASNGVSDQARQALLIFTGTPGTTRVITFPNVEKLTWCFNNCSDGSNLTLTSGAGTNVTLPALCKALVYTDGATNTVLLMGPYGEGTFTPTLQFNGLSVGITYSAQIGRWTRNGRLVSIEIQLSLTSKGSSTGLAQIAGLPFVCSVSPLQNCALRYSNVTLNTAGGFYSGAGGFTTSAGQTNVALQQQGSAVAPVNLDDTNFSNSSAFRVNASYSV